MFFVIFPYYAGNHKAKYLIRTTEFWNRSILLWSKSTTLIYEKGTFYFY